MGDRPDELKTAVKVIRNGRVTIPIAIRDALGIKDGDTILITLSKRDFSLAAER